MLKKFITGAVAGGLLAVSSVAATAAPIAFEKAARTSSPVASSEGLDGGLSDVALVAIFAAIAAGIIVVIESSEGSDLPTSP